MKEWKPSTWTEFDRAAIGLSSLVLVPLLLIYLGPMVAFGIRWAVH